MTQNLYGRKIKWNNIYMIQTLYNTKFIWDKNYMTQKYMIQTLYGTNFIWNKIYMTSTQKPSSSLSLFEHYITLHGWADLDCVHSST